MKFMFVLKDSLHVEGVRNEEIEVEQEKIIKQDLFFEYEIMLLYIIKDSLVFN